MPRPRWRCPVDACRGRRFRWTLDYFEHLITVHEIPPHRAGQPLS